MFGFVTYRLSYEAFVLSAKSLDHGLTFSAAKGVDEIWASGRKYIEENFLNKGLRKEGSV